MFYSVAQNKQRKYLDSEMHLANPAGSFFPLLSSTPMIWSLTSALEIRLNSLELGRRSGTSGRMAGKARSAPTMDVASVLGTPFRSDVEMMQLAAYK